MELFPASPTVTISLAATAVLCALNNLRTGQNEHSLKPVPFESDIYIGRVQRNEIWENILPVRREAICKAIYERIALHTGLRADEAATGTLAKFPKADHPTSKQRTEQLWKAFQRTVQRWSP
ncbi:hypothetical protein BDZ91DRAFT_787311 [Kalaharituber pfeilii]|nr:hypothetical protein BDZ91DRAFT_787311 [Kalaharituber pfeilii]